MLALADHPKNFKYVKMSLLLALEAFSELKIITKSRTNLKELEVLGNKTFKFYRVSLQYMATMEYCNLFESDKGNNDLNISSLKKLSEILSKKNNEFKSITNECLIKIGSLEMTKINGKIRELRNKKFGHSAGDYPVTPYSIKGLTINEINLAIEHLHILGEILQSYCKLFNYDYDYYHSDDRTENFIKKHKRQMMYLFGKGDSLVF